MPGKNQSTVTEFFFVGFTDVPDLQYVLFLVFLVIYVVTAMGNLGLIILIRTESCLHTPMYFFLSHLAFMDFCYSSVTAPKILGDLVEKTSIPYGACIAQYFFFTMFLAGEFLLLVVMAYDRYIAISNPLLYTVVMTKRLSSSLMVGVYIWGIVNSLVQTGGLLRLSFCGPNLINHYFCDLPALLLLSCTDTFITYNMLGKNQSTVTEFFFVGFTDVPDLQCALFVLFLVIYAVTVFGNLGLIMLIKTESCLHTPMYFFLSHLAFIDFCYSSVTSPKILGDLMEKISISYGACIAQFFFFTMFVSGEYFLLGVMAYDRYMAISNPLLYTVVMTKKLCSSLMVGVYIWGFVNSLVHTSGLLKLSFCGPNVINHYFCDLPALLLLSCTDTLINELLLFTFGTVFEISILLILIINYVFIIIAVLRIPSTEGRYKAFNTCASHLTSIAILHGTIIFMYFRPPSSYSLDTDKVSSVFYTSIIPMLNPVIYSVRNTDVKYAFRKMIERKTFFFFFK
ncbi:olfactory receptor 1052-like [Alligator mississippiensis]|uniref:olfactory receptor 1052-like n=1 Tax=Alligator mississippiensis TaxID=8496 RepID=UPI002877636A|nr:olfactory receptor 1052-like [Alligator mississippiensis]